MGVGATDGADHIRSSKGADRMIVHGDVDPDGSPITSAESTVDGSLERRSLYVQSLSAGTVVYGTNIFDQVYDYAGLGATLYGYGGGDALSTRGGISYLYGGPEADIFETYYGADGSTSHIFGASGEDIMRSFDSEGNPTTAYQDGGTAADRLVARTDRAYLNGRSGNDRLVTSANAKYINLKGWYGNDTIITPAWNGVVRGGPGRDVWKVRRTVATYGCEVIRRWP